MRPSHLWRCTSPRSLSDALEWPHAVLRAVTLVLILGLPIVPDHRLVSRRAGTAARQHS
jgi:hypothetical protein